MNIDESIDPKNNAEFNEISGSINSSFDNFYAQEFGYIPEIGSSEYVNYSNIKNAYGHAYASAYLTYKYNGDRSKLLGLIKEIATLNDEIKNHSENGTNIERGEEIAYKDGSRDMWNNNQGIEYAKLGISSSQSLEYVASQIFNDLINGNDFIIDFNTDGRTWNNVDNVQDFRNSLYIDAFYSMPDNLFKFINLLQPDFVKSILNMYEKVNIDIDSLISKLNISNNLKNSIKDLFENAQNASPSAIDPLILDLDNNGIETIDVDNGLFFDHEVDGFAELSAWVGGNDGILAYDKNGNGIIDNGNELFGDNYIKSDGTKASSGFDALSDLDSNNDGVINSSDEKFSELLVIKADGSIVSASEAGIASINLSSQQTNQSPDANGNTALSTGTFTTTDGSTNTIADYALDVNKTYSIETDKVEISDEIAALPEVSGYGVVRNLSQAMARDESGELQELVESFANETNIGVKKNILTQILYKWTGADTIAEGSRGNNIDAKELHVIEQFMGETFTGTEGTGNPNDQAANLLKNIYTSINMYVYSELQSQTGLKFLYDKIGLTETESGDLVLDLSEVKDYISNAITTDEQAGQVLLTDFSQTFVKLGYKEGSNYNEFYDYFCSLGQDYQMLMESADKTVKYGTENSDNIEGTAEEEAVFAGGGNDTIYSRQGDDLIYGGEGNDYIDSCQQNDKIYGEAGNDTILSGNDNDIVYGGTGDDSITTGTGNDTVYGESGDDYIHNDSGSDYLDGGSGNDTIEGCYQGSTIIGGLGNDAIISHSEQDLIIFNPGDGNDTIQGTDGAAVLQFGEGISADKIHFEAVDRSDILITFEDLTDTILLDNAALSPDSRVSQLKFADGTVITAEEIASNLITQGTSGSDSIIGSVASEKIYGNDGNDTIISYEGNDSIYGGPGNDYLENNADADYIDGGSGNDTLKDSYHNDTFMGGLGNDYIEAGGGDDLILFNIGDGHDTIKAADGNDTIRFSEGFDPAKIHYYSDKNDNVTIAFDGISDTVTLENTYGSTNSNRVLEFSYGTVLTYQDMMNNLEIQGTSGSDSLIGSSAAEKIYGNDGNDTIISYEGNDSIYGGAGNDYLENNSGNDYIEGGAGNDTLIAHGNDTLVGGTGNDVLEGRNNAEEYVFNLGDGHDTIKLSWGNDTITFTEGFNAEDIHFYSDNDNNVLIEFDGIDDSILMENVIGGSNGSDKVYKFSDGTVLTYQDMMDSLEVKINMNNDSIVGTNESEVLDGGPGDDTIIGNGGFDTIYGGEGNDSINNNLDKGYIDGGAGNDTLMGNNSGSTFIGGLGDDIIYSNTGDDVYYFNKGDGNDRIDEQGGNDTIYFGDGFTSENIIFSGYDTTRVKITFNNSEDSIILENALHSDGKKIEKFVFSDGTVLTSADMLNNLTTYGTSTGENISGSMGAEKIYGYDGDDTINSGEGFDTIYGGNGNDSISNNSGPGYLYGEAGNDTLMGSNSGNTFIGGVDNDLLYGNSGNDIYQFNLGDGQDTIQDSGGTDRIEFGESVERTGIALYMDSNRNLIVDYGTESGTDVICANNQQNGTINELRVNEGNSTYTMSDTAINQLIQDMSSYATEQGISLTSVEDVKNNADLMNMVNSAWTQAA